ncbi:MAG: M64 family metallopeptidase [Bacteroidota bacterium]
MKNNFLILFCFLGFCMNSQITTGVDTLWKTGPVSNRINLVFMGDGYTTSQIPLFISDVTTTYSYLLNTSPFNNYKNYFNVYAIKCESPQSGVSHPANATDVTEPVIPVSNVTNYFNTRFDNYGTHRLIYSMNPNEVYNVLANHFPNYSQIVILGNSPEYGGAGGAYAVSSTHTSSKEIVAHEMGHSFAGLADEYWAGPSAGSERPNMTSDGNASTVKWAQWVGITGVSTYPYGTVAPDNTWFRPHQNCKMRYLNQPFCAVCKEAIIEKIHSLITPIDSYSPSSSSVVSYTTASRLFKTKLVLPNPNTLKTTWSVNGVDVAHNQDSLVLNSSAMPVGNNSLLFTVIDTTILSKDLVHPFDHTFSVLWNINNLYAGIQEVEARLEYSMFPNPTSDKINLKYKLLEESDITVSIVDVEGKTVVAGKKNKQAIGEYKTETDVSQLKNGTYFLSITINSQIINNKFVILK